MAMIEDIILMHTTRGMDLLREMIPEDFCNLAAEKLLSLPKGNILFTTGFCVNGCAETDGPPGVIAMAWAVEKLGYTPIVVTDEMCRGIFESEGLRTEYFPIDGTETDAQRLLKKYEPTALFSLERCGVNLSGEYRSMRGIDIRQYTAPIDLLFMSAEHIETFGIGDGGNEIGMGNLADLIVQKLTIDPCTVTVDHLIIATVSNWGGYGICAALQKITRKRLIPTPDEIAALMKRLNAFSLVDGMSGLPATTEDGFPEHVTEEILNALEFAAR